MSGQYNSDDDYSYEHDDSDEDRAHEGMIKRVENISQSVGLFLQHTLESRKELEDLHLLEQIAEHQERINAAESLDYVTGYNHQLFQFQVYLLTVDALEAHARAGTVSISARRLAAQDIRAHLNSVTSAVRVRFLRRLIDRIGVLIENEPTTTDTRVINSPEPNLARVPWGNGYVDWRPAEPIQETTSDANDEDPSDAPQEQEQNKPLISNNPFKRKIW